MVPESMPFFAGDLNIRAVRRSSHTTPTTPNPHAAQYQFSRNASSSCRTLPTLVAGSHFSWLSGLECNPIRPYFKYRDSTDRSVIERLGGNSNGNSNRDLERRGEKSTAARRGTAAAPQQWNGNGNDSHQMRLDKGPRDQNQDQDQTAWRNLAWLNLINRYS